MIRTVLVAAFALACVSSTAEARRSVAHPDCNIVFPCEGVASSPRGEYIAKQLGFGGAQKVYTRQAQRKTKTERNVASYGAPSHPIVRAVSGLVAPLAAKVAEIQSACGSKLISGVRHTHIAGTRRMSLHAEGKAADMAGNPSCIYSLLHGWAGGHSTDYATAPGGAHVHISYDAQNGREMGTRFVHGGGKTRYARRNHRYASLR